ncbi:hypothetical protein RN001_003757 [Aquatica leii]|uniref:Uncharacterized protein n=1 Tax=Aquatica leii TaxID=1421715 RepID=A0AAN7PP71_9COLE|nr:hypothetical protein RN001_003757 [Aquatica leii]
MDEAAVRDDFFDYPDYVEEIGHEKMRIERLPKRYIRDSETPLEFFEANEFRRRYRFTKEATVHILFPLVDAGLSKPNNRRLPFSPMLQLISLRYYATCSFQEKVFSVADFPPDPDQAGPSTSVAGTSTDNDNSTGTRKQSVSARKKKNKKLDSESSPEDSDYSVQVSDSDLTLSDSSANAELSKELDRLIQPDDFVIVKFLFLFIMIDSSSDSEIEIASAALVLSTSVLLLEKEKQKRKKWSRKWLQRRSENGILNMLNTELLPEDPTSYRNFVRLPYPLFTMLLNLIEKDIEKQDTVMRDSITAQNR